MKYKNILLSFFTIILYCFIICISCYASQNTANTISALSVKGNQIVDENGAPIQLKGISTHGIAWFPDYINEYCFKELKQKWGINVIRIAMYTAESGGYCTDGNKEYLKNLVKKGVDCATKCDMYVIIDWHILSDGNPNTYIEESKAFFDEMSKKYCNQKNIIYEICNEPNGNISWNDIKQYAEQIITVIRKNDPNNIILVGTPNWSQSVDKAAENRIKDFNNIMYTLHFYAATHKQELRNTMKNALEQCLPIFVSEYGICDASGTGQIDIQQSNEWIQFLNQNHISYVMWNISNKAESSAILKSDCKKTSGFTQNDITDTGIWLYEMLTNTYTSHIPDTSQNIQNINNVSNDLQVHMNMINHWQQYTKYYYQYDITIINNGKNKINNWNISIPFDSTITLINSWNGIFTMNQNQINIHSMDYNAQIEKGQSITNIGMIISSDTKIYQ
ncbi:glycoside hydrolase family 5 protein [Lachnospiraceae bacterium 46-61]